MRSTKLQLPYYHFLHQTPLNYFILTFVVFCVITIHIICQQRKKIFYLHLLKFSQIKEHISSGEQQNKSQNIALL